MALRLTFAEESIDLIRSATDALNKQDLDRTKRRLSEQLQSVQQSSFKQAFIYSTKSFDFDSAIVDRTRVGLTSAGFQVIQFGSIDTILADLTVQKPAGVIINIDEFDEIKLLTTAIIPGAWKVIARNTSIVIASQRSGNPTFKAAWENLINCVVLQEPPDIIELIAIFNRSKDSATVVPFGISLETNFKRVQLATDSFTKFTVSVSEQVSYTVQLSVQGIPALSTSVPIPNSGVPPFEGVLKTNIGIVTVLGEHVLSLIGTGGGLTKSALITYKTN